MIVSASALEFMQHASQIMRHYCWNRRW